eukprot:CAMPEP_0184319894 /NCGR_PEP_ID=MMETSP1049-20130417/111153_1 /TAXON_ID=77928 /ORGANISM="Proteomonas sulcata, Strain CCMP704" /LENGTH=50 /DNA_ID=CAMNT_0026640219 /DNA_START=36 /DNA_END=185 /DNA_ORIENTATION=-
MKHRKIPHVVAHACLPQEASCSLLQNSNHAFSNSQPVMAKTVDELLLDEV